MASLRHLEFKNCIREEARGILALDVTGQFANSLNLLLNQNPAPARLFTGEEPVWYCVLTYLFYCAVIGRVKQLQTTINYMETVTTKKYSVAPANDGKSIHTN